MRTKERQRLALLVILGLLVAALVVAALLWANSGTPKDVNNREEPAFTPTPTAEQ